MNISELKPSFDDLMQLNFFDSDTWYEDSNGCPHQMTTGYNGEHLQLLRPEFIPAKYKGRKFNRAVILTDHTGNIKTYDALYGRASIDGFAVRHEHTVCFGWRSCDVTASYRC